MKQRKKTSSTSKPRKPTAPSMNSSASTINESSISDSAKPTFSKANAKTSSPAVPSSNTKKPSGKQGRFAFQGQKSTPRSLPSDELTPQERLFSLQDLKELASIVQSSGPARVPGASATDTAPTIAASTKVKKTIKKREPGVVAFQKKNGRQVSFKAQKGKAVAAPVVPQVEQGVPLDMPDLSGYTASQSNPYSYAFS